MHAAKIFFAYALVIFLIIAGVAQALQPSTWLPLSFGAGFEDVMKKIQTAALYAFVPLSAAGLNACCFLCKKHGGKYSKTGADESSAPLM